GGYEVAPPPRPVRGGGESGGAARAEDAGHFGPAPSAVPGAVNQDERLCRRRWGDVRCCRTRRNGRGHRQKGPTIHWEPPRVVLLFASHSSHPGPVGRSSLWRAGTAVKRDRDDELTAHNPAALPPLPTL